MVIASDENWAAFRKRFGKSGSWLEYQGLPRADLYDIVFAGNEPTGIAVAEAGDEEGIEGIMALGTMDDKDSGDSDDIDAIEDSQRSLISSPTSHLSSTPARALKRGRSKGPSSGRGGLKRFRHTRDNSETELGFDRLITSLRRHTDVVTRESGV